MDKLVTIDDKLADYFQRNGYNLGGKRKITVDEAGQIIKDELYDGSANQQSGAILFRSGLAHIDHQFGRTGIFGMPLILQRTTGESGIGIEAFGMHGEMISHYIPKKDDIALRCQTVNKGQFGDALQIIINNGSGSLEYSITLLPHTGILVWYIPHK